MNAVKKLNDDIENVGIERTVDRYQTWADINWSKAEKFVNRLQVRIAKATVKGNLNLAKRLGYLLTHSFYAKALAIKEVTSNKGKNTPGPDGQIWRTDEEKFNNIKSLETKGYKAKPLKRVYIEKYGKQEKRPLSIPTIKDRSMQMLCKMALDPIAETQADRTSFGFRKHRSPHDAMQYTFTLLSRRYSPQWILEGDIKGCFDNISHTWLMKNVSMDKTLLKEFLNAGFVYRQKLFDTLSGTPQGGVISPTLANITLDGLEEAILDGFYRDSSGVKGKRYNPYKIHLVRFADDFIVTATSEKALTQIKTIIDSFLVVRGLELSKSKTSITNITSGFDFLGWNFRKFNKKLIVAPSKKSISKIKRNLSIAVNNHKANTQAALIRTLNPMIRGWSNYHQSVCAAKAYGKLNHNLWNMLWRWAKRRHPNKGRRWIKERYWPSQGSLKWLFRDGDVMLENFRLPIVRHCSLKLGMNPYLDADYVVTRKKRLAMARKKAKYAVVACQ